jgi:hypothetical protein
MINLQEINKEIHDMKNRQFNTVNCERLLSLYQLRKHMEEDSGAEMKSLSRTSHAATDDYTVLKCEVEDIYHDIQNIMKKMGELGVDLDA